mgnify:CR=1 FL=1
MRIALHGGKIVVGMTTADSSLDTVGIGNFAVRTGTYAQVIAELPIVQIMAALHISFCKSRCFVVNKACAFQFAMYGLFIWIARYLLREERTGFAKLKLLSLPNRFAIWVAKWVWLTIIAIASMMVMAVLSTAVTLGSLALTDQPWQQFVGASAAEYLKLGVMITIIAVGTVAFGVAVAIFTNNLSSALTMLFMWVLVIEGMLNGADESTRILYSLLPFKNGTRVFENPPMEWFMWNSTVSVGYFLVVTIGLAALAIAFNKSKMTRDE